MVAAAIIPILVLTACNSSTSSSPPAASSAAGGLDAGVGTGLPGRGRPRRRPHPGRSSRASNVNILTFNGPQVAEPLQRRAPDWEQLTGGHVNVVAVGFQTIYDKALLDASTGTNSLRRRTSSTRSGWATSSGPGYLLDLTDRVKNDPQLNQQDIVPFFRDFNATYNGKIYTIPLDGDFHMVYYRTDLLAKDGLKPPATWDDYLTIAQKYNGQDLNGDGQPDYGSCIAKKKGAQSYWWIISIAAGLLQSKGTSQGAFFDTTNMNPLFGQNEAMTLALQTYAKTATVRSARRAEHGRRRITRPVHDRALCPDDGLGRHRHPGARAPTPRTRPARRSPRAGSRSSTAPTGKLVPCDATTCPNAVDGVNYAPFGSFGGWSGAVNAKSPKAQQDAAYDFLSYMSAPAQSSIDVTLGKTGFNPYRTSQFTNSAPWLDRRAEPDRDRQLPRGDQDEPR